MAWGTKKTFTNVPENTTPPPGTEDLSADVFNRYEDAIDDLLSGAALPNASTGGKGIVELATTTETADGLDSTRAVTPVGLKPLIEAAMASGGSGGGSDGGGYILKGDSAILSGTTTRTISLIYLAPAADLDIRIVALDNGGLGAFNFYLTNITANALTNTTSFTVNLVGGTPSNNLEFRWFIGGGLRGESYGFIDEDGYLSISDPVGAGEGSPAYATESRQTPFTRGLVSYGVTAANKFYWSGRIMMIPLSSAAASDGYIQTNVSPPTSGVTDPDGTERANANGITLDFYESLWLHHTRGGTALEGWQFAVTRYTDVAVNKAYSENPDWYRIAWVGDSALYVADGTRLSHGQTAAADQSIGYASSTIPGAIEIATQAEVNTGTDVDRAVTPATLANYPGLGGGGVFNVKSYGALGTGSGGATQDQAGFAAAITAAGANGVVYIPPGTYYLTGGFTQGTTVQIKGAGSGNTQIVHTGNNALFTGTAQETSFLRPRQWVGFEVIGNSGVSACAIVHGNSYRGRFEDVSISAYTGGDGIRINSTTTWTEGTTFKDVQIRNCKRNLAFLWDTGVNQRRSFSDTHLDNVSINTDAANQVGLFIQASSLFYNSSFKIKFYIAGAGSIAWDVGNSATLQDNLYLIETELDAAATGAIGRRTGTNCVVRGIGIFSNIISKNDSDGTGTKVALANPSPMALEDAGWPIESTLSNFNQTGTSAYIYQLAGIGKGWMAGGYSLATGSNLGSPVIHMTDIDGNAMLVRTVSYLSNVASGSDVFKVDNRGHVMKPLESNDTDRAGTANVTLAATDRTIQRLDSNLTANRTWTLPITGLAVGQQFHIVSRNTANFTLAISDGTTTLSTIPASTRGWVRVRWNGTAWKVHSTGGNY